MIARCAEIASLECNRIEIVKTTMMETIKLETSKTIECNFWKSYCEHFCKPGGNSFEWERSASQDGGRDSHSCFIAVPVKPCFRRSLPEHCSTNSAAKE